MTKELSTSGRRWQKVRGMMSAVIATLLDLNWTPAGADQWIDSDGEIFNLRSGDPDLLVNYALRGAIGQEIWKGASQWHLGLGLSGGVDLTVMKEPHQATTTARTSRGGRDLTDGRTRSAVARSAQIQIRMAHNRESHRTQSPTADYPEHR